jgi:hypothetical protein
VVARLGAVPSRPHGAGWDLCVAQRDFVKEQVDRGLRLTKVRRLFQRRAVISVRDVVAVCELGAGLRRDTGDDPCGRLRAWEELQKDRPGGGERPAGRFPGRIRKGSRDSPVRSRLTGVGSEISGCPALRFLAVAHSRRRGREDYGHPCHSRRARADRSCGGKILAWAACVIRVSYMDFYTVWRFWRFLFSSNLRGLNTAKEIDSRRLHHNKHNRHLADSEPPSVTLPPRRADPFGT